ncbi:MAG: carboxylating nicotinate-nucleotide diphosphorylase [Ignavibacteriaceae bacterium]|nr:carboxylating nicotinate-nucleotide diphosphorylase [Ignavibacteriaceae bacterium]
MNIKLVDRIIETALEEDIKSGDITTEATVGSEALASGDFLLKAPGKIAGLEVAERVFMLIDESLRFEKFVGDGDTLEAGIIIASVRGKASSILTAERTALNMMQRMSGIATTVESYKKRIAGSKTKILDTRKTVPGLRYLDKLAVRIGGGINHRSGLYDMYLIKDNHIIAAGSITNAVKLCKEHQVENETSYKIEVEVSNFTELEEALNSSVDIIMLDNFPLNDLREAVKIVNNRCLIEASGGITLDTIAQIAECGVDYISVGAITHSVSALDISLDLRLHT